MTAHRPLRTGDTVAGCFGIWFAFVAILALAATGVGIWAVIVLVNHFTA